MTRHSVVFCVIDVGFLRDPYPNSEQRPAVVDLAERDGRLRPPLNGVYKVVVNGGMNLADRMC